jgi:hypothetical protein
LAAWVCGTDQDTDTDTDTTYSAGAGLNLTGTTFGVASSGVTSAMIQDNSITSNDIADSAIAFSDVGGNSCAANQVMKRDASNGAWVCADDQNTGTAYSAGTGLNQSATTFSVDFAGTGSANTVARSDHTHPNGIPTGMIAFFAGACPSGWSEYTGLQGRALVGMPDGGTLEGVVGSPLGDQGTRAITSVPAHTHAVDPPNTGTSNDGGHGHSVSDPGHEHSFWSRNDDFNCSGDGGGSWGVARCPDNGSHTWPKERAKATGNTTGISIGSGGSHSHSVNIASFNSGSTGSSSVDVTMPYIQLRACVAP